MTCFDEWINGSAIDPALTQLNRRWLYDDEEIFSRLIPDIDAATDRVHPDAQWRWIEDRYWGMGRCGWWSSGINLITLEDSDFGCFKSDSPRVDHEKSVIYPSIKTNNLPLHEEFYLLQHHAWTLIDAQIKYKKYEHPLRSGGVSAGIFALRVTPAIWQKVAHRYEVELPNNYECLPYSAFWQWVIDHPAITCWITEGVKKAAALLSCGYVAIALPGVSSGFRTPKDDCGHPDGPSYLHPELQPLATEGRKFLFAFDQDTKFSTVRNVGKCVTKMGHLLKKRRCTVRVATWSPILGKGVDDVIVTMGREFVDLLYRESRSFEEWQTQQFKKLTYGGQTINRKYFLNKEKPDDTMPPVDAQVIALKGYKGGGKTYWLSHIIEPVLKSGRRRVLLLTHLIQLSLQGADRLGIPYVTNVNSTEEGSLLGMGLVINSLHPKSQAHFNPEEWRGGYVIIDEVMQVLWALLESSTCRDDRVQIIKNLKRLLINVISHGGKIFIADADLTDIAIDFIKSLVEQDLKVWVLENTYKSQPWNIFHFQDKTPARMFKMLEKRLAVGEKHLVATSAQKASSRWGTRNLEKMFKEKFPSLRILRIDSETTQDPTHPACGCTEFLNEIVVNYDLVLSSPTIQSGVSIDVKHFHGVWGSFGGVQSPDVVRQHLARYRVPVPRYLWVSKIGNRKSFVGDRSTTMAGMISSQNKKTQAHIQRFVSLGIEENLDGTFENVCLRTWAVMGAWLNADLKRYSKVVLEGLEAEGHTILPVATSDKSIFLDEDCSQQMALPTESEAEELKCEAKVTSEAEYTVEREKTSASRSVDDLEFKRLSKQQRKTYEEQLILDKALLERRYRVEVTPDLVLKDDEGWYPQIKLHYYLTVGRHFVNFHDQSTAAKQITQGGGNYFQPDMNRALWGMAVQFLDDVGIQRLYLEEKLFDGHPVIADIVQQCRERSYDTKQYLGIDIREEKSNIRVIQRILETIGHKMPFLGKKGPRGAQIRMYGSPCARFRVHEDTGKPVLDDKGLAIPLPDGREEVFAVWVEKDAQELRKYEDEKAAAATAARAQQESMIQQYAALTQDEQDQASLLIESLPTIANDGETLEQLLTGLSLKAIVYSLRSLCAEVRASVLSCCQSLRSMVSGMHWAT